MTPHTALNRFAFGAKPGQAASLGSARDWLLSQLTPQPMPAALATLPRTADVLMEFPQFLAQQKIRPQGQTPNEMPPTMAAPDNMGASTATPAASVETSFRQRFGPGLVNEVQARFAAAVQSETGFHERLVWFWSNHFAVSATRAQVINLAGPYEREAIRPHVNGRFVDMLLAVMRHPAMLIYLDNQQSFGPNSRAGQRRDKGLNENLAREALELHTLGVNGGYTQTDVTELARALTGWGVRYNPLVSGEDRFVFDAARHEPGARTVMGRRYPEGGAEQAEAVLRDLAAHPSTANFVVYKLARHFVADEPPPVLVKRLAQVFLDTGGSLLSLHKTLVDAPEAWQGPPSKVKRPDEYLVSSLRALGVNAPPGPMLQTASRAMGQQQFYAPSPQGWPDQASSWLAPDSLLKRLEWADATAHRVPTRDVRALAADVLGPQLTPATQREIERAESPQQALVLLLASPEFLRR
ncbi:MAG: DUF1800 family protein [Burkholderiales bacterium]